MFRGSQERELRAWSQNQLAEVANLSLRTVQRVEKSGAASYETCQALASAFSIGADELQSLTNTARLAKNRRPSLLATLSGGLIGVIATLLSLLLFTAVQAQEILLDIDYSNSGQHSEPFSIADHLDKDMTFTVDDEFRIVVTASLTKSENIRLVFNIYQGQDGDYKLISRPTIITGNQQQAEIIMNHNNADELAIRITPYYGLL